MFLQVRGHLAFSVITFLIENVRKASGSKPAPRAAGYTGQAARFVKLGVTKWIARRLKILGRFDKARGQDALKISGLEGPRGAPPPAGAFKYPGGVFPLLPQVLELVERRLVASFRFLAAVTHQVRVGEDQLAQRLVKLFSCDEQPLLGHSAQAADLQCPLDFDASGGQPPERLGPAHQIVGVQVGEIQADLGFEFG